MSAESVKFGVTLYKLFTTAGPEGTPMDASPLPVGTLYRDGGDCGASVSVNKLEVGLYAANVALSGYGIGKDSELSLAVEATVSGVDGAAEVWKGRVTDNDFDDVYDSLDAGVSLEADAITADVLAASATDEIVTALFSGNGITVNGVVNYGNIWKALYAMARGKATKSADNTYVFYDDDDTEVAFTWQIGTVERTPK